jgi:hypothetical protein
MRGDVILERRAEGQSEAPRPRLQTDRYPFTTVHLDRSHGRAAWISSLADIEPSRDSESGYRPHHLQQSAGFKATTASAEEYYARLMEGWVNIVRFVRAASC